MNPVKEIIILLTILCVIGSAAAVSAEDIGSEDGYAGCNYDDAGLMSESQDVPDDQTLGEDAHDGQETGCDAYGNPEYLPPDWNHDEHAAGEPYNETEGNSTDANVTDASSASGDVADNSTFSETANGTGNATSSSPQSMHATGNPILALLAVGAVLGASAVIRKK